MTVAISLLLVAFCFYSLALLHSLKLKRAKHAAVRCDFARLALSIRTIYLALA